MKFEYLYTDRLQLRMLTPETYHQVFSAMNDDELKLFFGFTTDAQLAMEQLKYTKGMTTYNRTFLLFQLLLKSTEKTIGSCGFHNWFPEHRRAEMGYVLLDDTHKQQGFMSEALQAIIHHGFATLNLNRIEACIGPANTASIRLIEKMKFTHEAILRQHYFKNEVLGDTLIYALLKDEYT